MDSKKFHGGAGRGQGRKPLDAGESMKPVTVYLKPAQKEKLQRIGGAPWVRQKIDDEPEPPKKE